MKCEVCWEAEATHTCRLCGRSVCPAHIDRVRGICSFCVEALCQVCGEQLSITHCAVCGRLVCLDCGVQVDTVLHVCRPCYTSLGGRSGVLARLRRGRRPPRMPSIRGFVEKVLEARRRGGEE